MCAKEKKLEAVEVAEAAGADQHEGEELKIIAGVDEDGGGQRPREEARGRQDKADGEEQDKGADGVAGLVAVQEGEGQAGGDGGGDLSGGRPAGAVVGVQGQRRAAGDGLGAPVEGCG